jgi:serralysin
MAILTAGVFGIDFDALSLSTLSAGQVSLRTNLSFTLDLSGDIVTVQGTNFTYGSGLLPIGGTIDRVESRYQGQLIYTLDGLSMSALTFSNLVDAGGSDAVKTVVFGGGDAITGSALGDILRGYDGADTISAGGGADVVDGGAGNDSVSAGAGNDTVQDLSGSNYLRGDDGNDSIVGGLGFDDINGNMGNDTCVGGVGHDWVVGGRDNDLLFGQAGDDVVLGNLGDDTCDGGAGADILRGGQANDSLSGGADSDFLSGDRGDDTISGGAGADVFHSFPEAGIDRILDFNAAEGDVLRIAAGSAYTVAQSGSDTVVTIEGAAQVVLVGVTAASLPPGWIGLG